MNLRNHKMISVGLALAAFAGASCVTYVSGALATDPRGVTTVALGDARFDAIDAAARTDVNPGRARDIWKARIRTNGATDVHMLQNTIAPGGTFVYETKTSQFLSHPVRSRGRRLPALADHGLRHRRWAMLWASRTKAH